MVRSIEGLYRDGKVELLEPAPPGAGDRVIVTFVTSSASIELAERGISTEQAADLRARLAAFSEDWGSADMDVYDAV